MVFRLIILMALRDAGERQHDNSGGSRKLSAVASVHSISLNIFGIISVQVVQEEVEVQESVRVQESAQVQESVQVQESGRG
jgi:hypothetical protein